MVNVLGLIGGGRWSYDGGGNGAGTTTITVPNGKQVIGGTLLSVSGGSFTISPGGANHPNPVVAGPSITVPAGATFSLSTFSGLGMLGGGTVFTCINCDSVVIEYVQMKVG